MEQIGDQPTILEAVACLPSRILQDPIIPASQVTEKNKPRHSRNLAF